MTVDATRSQSESSLGTPSSDEQPSSGRVSGVGTATRAGSLSGELRRPPRSAFWTFVLGATGLLALGHILAFTARLTLGLRRPASLEITPSGIRVEQQTLLLGRVVRDRKTVVPLDALLRVTREVRFARTGLYVGLTMLALGSYFGVGLFVDGLRAPGGSPSLIFMGLVVTLVGLLLDFGLSSLADTARSRCQITVVPVRGRSVCIGALEPHQADAVLRRVATELGIEPEHPEAEPRQLLEKLGKLAERTTAPSRAAVHPKSPPAASRGPDASDTDADEAPPAGARAVSHESATPTTEQPQPSDVEGGESAEAARDRALPSADKPVHNDQPAPADGDSDDGDSDDDDSDDDDSDDDDSDDDDSDDDDSDDDRANR